MKQAFLYTIALCVVLATGMEPLFGQAPPVRVNLRLLFQAPLPPLSAGTPVFAAGKGIMVFLFLSPECPLCQNYSLILNQLYKQFGSGTRFYGIIPGKTDPSAGIDAFVNKYHILFPLYRDPALAVVRRLHAEVTPQAIVLNGEGVCIYSGLIDDWVTDLGTKRAHVDRHFLLEALTAAGTGQRLSTARTTPIGCLINAY